MHRSLPASAPDLHGSPALVIASQVATAKIFAERRARLRASWGLREPKTSHETSGNLGWPSDRLARVAVRWSSVSPWRRRLLRASRFAGVPAIERFRLPPYLLREREEPLMTSPTPLITGTDFITVATRDFDARSASTAACFASGCPRVGANARSGVRDRQADDCRDAVGRLRFSRSERTTSPIELWADNFEAARDERAGDRCCDGPRPSGVFGTCSF
jgi:hypothetical protein